MRNSSKHETNFINKSKPMTYCF